MTKRSPAEYDFPALEFDEHLLTKHFTPLGSRKIEFVVVHHMTIVDTSDQGALDACYRVWLERQASAHYGVAGELVTQYVWDKDYAWACGDTYGNLHGIHIEHRNSSTGPEWLVAALTMQTSAELAAWLHVVYDLGRPVDRVTLRQHDEFFPTACPGPFLGGTEWDAYVHMVQRLYDQITGAVPVPEVPPTIDGSYVMKAGDTLWSVSQQFGVTVAELSKWNEITDHMSLPIGARLDVTAPPEPEPSPHVAVWGKPETFVLGATGPDVTRLGERIVIWSKALDLPDPYNVGPGPKHGPRDVSGLSAIQVAWGYGSKPADLALGGNSDGYPGPVTFTDLDKDPPKYPEADGLLIEAISANLAGYDVKGGKANRVHRARTTIPDYLRPKHPMWFHFQECAIDMWPELDKRLTGYTRVPEGGKGRESYYRNGLGIKIIEAKLMNVTHMLAKDTKEFLVIAWECDGYRAVDVNFHSENQGIIVQPLQMRDVLKAAYAMSNKHGIPAANVLATGDANFKGAAAFIRLLHGWNEVFYSAKKTIDLQYHSTNGWRARLTTGRRIDVDATGSGADILEAEQLFGAVISDHWPHRVKRRLY